MSWNYQRVQIRQNLEFPEMIKLKSLTSKHSIKWIWVKGHAQNKYNNIVDELAQGAIKK